MVSLPKHKKYVIIGAGMHGLSTAWHLAKELKALGFEVTEKVGGYGVATILCLRDDMKYPNLWREVDFDSDEVNDEAGVYGWLTSVPVESPVGS